MYLELASGRNHHEHFEDSPRRAAAPFDHGPEQSRGDKRHRPPPGPARQDQRRLCHGQPDDPAGGRRDAGGVPVPGHPGARASLRPRGGRSMPPSRHCRPGRPPTRTPTRASRRSGRNCGPRTNTSRPPTRSWRPPTKSSNPRTRKCSRSTRNCNPPTRNWRPPRKNCSRSTRSWPRSTPNCNNKVADLSRLNNDMNNLLAGTGIATVFVDHQLRILRFTPSATRIINLIPSDIGRPVGHIVSNLVGLRRPGGGHAGGARQPDSQRDGSAVQGGHVVLDAHPCPTARWTT